MAGGDAGGRRHLRRRTAPRTGGWKPGRSRLFCYVESKQWAVRYTAEFDQWYKALPDEQAARITARINLLQRTGPTLGRPWADRIHGSPCHNMKELRSRDLRVLFAFATDQRAVMLVGGDKSGNWQGWYDENLPRALRHLADYERSLGKGEPSRNPSSRSRGRRSNGRDR